MRILTALALCAMLFAAMPGNAMATSRVALVIGNSAYKHATPLKNPSNDANDMARALEKLGFRVVVGRDLRKAGMEGAIREFTRLLPGADVALFYFAGHGLQVGGQNYLAPVEARLKAEADLDFEAVSLRLVLKQMEREQRTNIVFLDACRDNPLAKNLSRSMGTRSTSVGRGLARVETGVGTLIAFATQPGNVALDGQGRNSPFTSALVKHIGRSGKSLSEIMISVRNDVLKESGGKQVPWERSSLTGQFYFSPPGKKMVEAAAPHRASRNTVNDRSVEVAFWESIRDGKNPKAFESYLTQYPSGAFAPLARLKLEELTDKNAEPAAKTARAPAAPATPQPHRRSHVELSPVALCDRVASVPFDPRTRGNGLWTLRKLLKPGKKSSGGLVAKAVEACRQAVAEQPNEPRLRYQLAIAALIAKGKGAGADVFQGLKWAADQQYPAAMLSMADSFKDKPPGGGRRLKGRVWLERATKAYRELAQAGNTAAMAGLALIHSGQYAKLGVGRQTAKTHFWLRQGVKGGSNLSAFLMMSMFSGEFGGFSNPKGEFAWLARQAKAGNRLGQFAAGLLLLSGEHGIAKDPVKAMDWLQRAKDNGATEAGLILALVNDQSGQKLETSARYVLEAFKAGTPFVFLLTDDKAFKLSSRLWTEVQRQLAGTGYYDGGLDGILGSGTKRALFAYATSD